MDKAALEQVMEAKAEGPLPKKRGRKSNAQKEREAEEALAREQAEAEKKAIGEWGPVARMALVSLSKVIDSQFPGCGWEKDEIESVIDPLSRRLNAMFPDGGENSDWMAVGMGLGIPLLARVQEYSKRQKKTVHSNGAASEEKVTK